VTDDRKKPTLSSPATRARVWLEIDLGTLAANYRRIAAAVAPADVMGVLKANAYGLGMAPIAAALARAGAARFGVAEPNEALALVALGLGPPVQILGSVLPEEIPEAAAAGVILPVTDWETARLLDDAGARLGRRVRAHVKIDTGMGRLGILVSDARALVPRIVRLPHLACEGIYSHFPAAYRAGAGYTGRQIDDFLSLLDDLAAQGISFAWRHMANSDAINNVPRAVRPPFNLVRTGINLHGAFDIEGRRTLDLRPVLSLRTRLTAVRRLPVGMSIGYGCTYTLPRETTVGTVSAGYADGLPLALSNRGHVLIRGRPCPVLGRVSMDYTTVSLEQVPDAAVGDEVICLGGEGPQAVTVEDWANLKATHPYEIICSFGNRVERRYVGEG
jgi:alanine racemase